MGKISKRQKQALRIQKSIDHFRCPLCKHSVQMEEGARITCTNNHSFDLAKQGYLFLLAKPSQTTYTKELFEERRNIHVHSSFYKDFHEKIADVINTYAPEHSTPTHMIDMGTGEGSHLQLISSRINNDFIGIGLDIAKEGIIQAARNDDQHIWMVADLAESPIASDSMDIVLNILSPSNYTEFSRVLKREGVVIKVLPGNTYVQEMRSFFQPTHMSNHSNERVKTHFKKYYQLIETAHVSNTYTLTAEERSSLARMSPLAWDASEDTIASFITNGPSEITIDLEIIVGK